MKKIVMIALLAVTMTLLAAPVFAATSNVRVGAEIDSTYLFRKRFDFGEKSVTEQQQLFITQTIVRLDADLTEKVQAVVALINERVWNSTQTSATTDIDLFLAYIALHEMLGSALDLYIGRQEFGYGNNFIFHTSGTNNIAPGDSGLSSVAEDLTKQTALDAVRAVLNYHPLTVDLVFAVVEPGSTTLTNNKTDVYLYGVNANYQLGDEMDSVIEAYFWKKVDKSDSTSTAGEKDDLLKVIGIRGSTNPIKRLNVQAEFATQDGVERVASREFRKRRAYAAQGIVNWQMPWWEDYNPTLTYVYTKTSGETDPTSDKTVRRGWDPFFEAQGGGTIYNALFDLTNSHIHTVTLAASPMEDVLAKVSLTSLWLYEELKAGALTVRQPDGTTESLTASNNHSHLGKEFDFELLWDYTEDVQFGLLTGWFFPGPVFRPSGCGTSCNDAPATQVLFNAALTF